jgi:hypothetical protein
VLAALDDEFAEAYAEGGRPSIASERCAIRRDSAVSRSADKTYDVQLAKTDTRDSSPSVGQPAETCLEHWLVSRHEAELTVKHSKVSANFFGCFLSAYVDKKIGAIVFPIPSLRHAINVSDWSDPIGERAIMPCNYVSRITRAAPNVGPIIGCFLCPSDRHPGFVYVEKLCSNRRDQDFAPSIGDRIPGPGREHANILGYSGRLTMRLCSSDEPCMSNRSLGALDFTPELGVKAWSDG